VKCGPKTLQSYEQSVDNGRVQRASLQSRSGPETASEVSRRSLLRAGVGVTAGVASATLLPSALNPGARATSLPVPDGPYGQLEQPDAHGLMLPPGFRCRIIARTGDPVANTGFTWHAAPDGGACFPTADRGWIYTSNAEVTNGKGGASAVRFDRTGTIISAYRILAGTSMNCAGGPTPWGTWLSCEEIDIGQVWECDPTGTRQAKNLPGLGTFLHEAATVDPLTGHVYLSEDHPKGRLYRFVPYRNGDLRNGQLFAARIENAQVTWVLTKPTEPDRQSQTTPFNGGEGLWIDRRDLYFTTKGDVSVWHLNLDTQRFTQLHNGAAAPSPLNAVDNVTVHAPSGDVFIGEDAGNMEIGLLARMPGRDGALVITPFARLLGQDQSEITGPAFAPDGSRLYFSSQRGTDGRGLTYEISGAFRKRN
jgi:uncharacterized protein